MNILYLILGAVIGQAIAYFLIKPFLEWLFYVSKLLGTIVTLSMLTGLIWFLIAVAK